MGAIEDQNTLNLITKKLEAIQSEEEVGAMVKNILDEYILAQHAVKTVGDMAHMVKALPPEVGELILGTAFTIGFATGVEFAKIRRSEVPSL